MKVVIVGSGNVAYVLGKIMQKNGHEILQVISRNAINAAELAKILNCDHSVNLLEMNGNMELCLVAVTDKHIAEVAGKIPASGGLIVHTAGSVDQDILSVTGNRYGVIYPVQTLNRQIEILPEIPVQVNGNNEQTRRQLVEFCKTWSVAVHIANDELRMNTHLAAVMVNNFTNHIMALTQDFCNKESVDFDLLFPLIHQTIHRLNFMPAFDLQTGPAVRNDISTIEKHLQSLNKLPELRKLYLKLSESIINLHKKRVN